MDGNFQLRHLTKAGKYDYEEDFFTRYFSTDCELQEYIENYEQNVRKSTKACIKNKISGSLCFLLLINTLSNSQLLSVKAYSKLLMKKRQMSKILTSILLEL
jgi:hypothetical protein